MAEVAAFRPGPVPSGSAGSTTGAPATSPLPVTPATQSAGPTLKTRTTKATDPGPLPPPPDGGAYDSNRILESLTVPTETSAGVTSQTVLRAGVTYSLVAWGNFQYDAGQRGDAQFRNFPHATPYAADNTTPIGLTFPG